MFPAGTGAPAGVFSSVLAGGVFESPCPRATGSGHDPQQEESTHKDSLIKEKPLTHEKGKKEL